MSKYIYRMDPDTVDLVDEDIYDESDLDQMHPDDVLDLARKELEKIVTVRRI